MRTPAFPVLLAVEVTALLFTPSVDYGQPPADKGKKGDKPKPPPDEFKSLVKELEEAYKAPFEVDKDILDELRKQYKNPTPEREAKILREARRLYRTTPRQEEEIVRELRAAYEKQSADQEQAVFQAIRRNGQLPPGTVPVEVQVKRAEKLFGGFDRDGDGALSREEAPEALLSMWRQFDRNRDGYIDFTEYGAYYQAHLRYVSDKVAAGEIEIKLPKGFTLPSRGQNPNDPAQKQQAGAQAPAGKAAVLPDWFTKLDADRDGQVSLYEWRQGGGKVDEFSAMDRDGDCLLTAQELLRFLADQARERALAERMP